MKIVHSLGWYFPDSCGGTEVYVDSLVRELTNLKLVSVVAAPRDGTTDDDYSYHGIAVHRYPVSPTLSRDQRRGTAPRGGFEQFASWLERERTDIYHQHSWTAGCGLHHLKWAKQIGLPTVMTIHLPGNVCMRDTMLRNGKTVCDGKIEVQRCGACWARHSGAPAWVAETFSRLPSSVSEKFNLAMPESKLSTLLSLPFLVAEFQRHFREMIDLADRVVVPSQWVYDALLANGVANKKLILSHQGVSEEFPLQLPPPKKSNRRLRMGYFGRWSALKGIDVLLKAIQKLPPSVEFDLSVHAFAAGKEEKILRDKILSSVNGERRFHIEESIPHEQVAKAIANFDLIVVPSTCLETGPLVVMEALAAGVPVLGSALGGIAELIQHGKNGWLVPAGDVAAWAAALRLFAEHPERLEELRKGIMPMRSMRTVAEEMSAIYYGLCRT
jgi:glycosyltransferase involved in cell wall biosynthesis